MPRLFIAINLPKEIKSEISKIIKETPTPLWFRWLPEWHITITFLGDQEDYSIQDIETAMQKTCEGMHAGELSVEFKEVCYGPPGRTPRMAWLTTTDETSRKIALFKRRLEDNLEKSGIDWERESRPFHGHVTLARFESTTHAHLPPIEQKFTTSFTVPSIDLIKSKLERTGAIYTRITAVAC
ncbi:RNA 2',3'-cyclic phosphodiesterase [Candidatus Jorgensenbacteria bacterium]|nr:RNA 2',3'-cyclic phosphodiesterase [Candidatus Jorgensenbacteria bacterium]